MKHLISFLRVCEETQSGIKSQISVKPTNWFGKRKNDKKINIRKE